MSDKEYRRDWAQDQARKKLREMRGEGLSNVEIGERTGVTGVFIGSILRKDNPKPVSKKVWDALIRSQKFRPLDPGTCPGGNFMSPTNVYGGQQNVGRRRDSSGLTLRDMLKGASRLCFMVLARSYRGPYILHITP